ncbi:hypothetical protein V8C40DRAFT_184665 [Trichoderma camerunense]
MPKCHKSTDADPDCSATFPENFLWQDRPRPELQVDVIRHRRQRMELQRFLTRGVQAAYVGGTSVICEGYASSDDPYALKGSCSVEYRLILTDKGEKRYPDVANPNGHWSSDGEGGTDLGAWAFAVIFFAVLKWILYSAYLA